MGEEQNSSEDWRTKVTRSAENFLRRNVFGGNYYVDGITNGNEAYAVYNSLFEASIKFYEAIVEAGHDMGAENIRSMYRPLLAINGPHRQRI